MFSIYLGMILKWIAFELIEGVITLDRLLSLEVLFEERIVFTSWSREQLELVARYFDISITLVPTRRLHSKIIRKIIELRADDKVPSSHT
jgi:hypothetical protein